ncbi:MAG: outer membrane beta-barrel protein [Dinghuibacter sp.]|nr:outer membrane beta-barrel protein [Dinghuibacter sp.]
MKRFLLIALCFSVSAAVMAQNEGDRKKSDTIRVGGLIIVTNKDKNKEKDNKNVDITIRKGNKEWDEPKRKRKRSNVKNNWFGVDLGFTNWQDETVYTSADAQQMLRPSGTRPAPSAGDFKLRTGKSVNVNVWIFTQRVSLIKHVLNLKYGIGMELNNFRFKTPLSFKDGNPPTVILDSVSFSKNKLAVDYVTVPLMLNINPSGRGGFGISGGISVGYRYSARNKQVSDPRGKEREKGDFGLNPWKLAVIGDIGWSGLRLYGSYSLTNLFEKGLNMTPYSIGLRFSSF